MLFVKIETELYENNSQSLQTIHLQSLDDLKRNYDLFVNDCLSIYKFDKNLVKRQYHIYGGNYKQLPGFSDKK